MLKLFHLTIKVFIKKESVDSCGEDWFTAQNKQFLKVLRLEGLSVCSRTLEMSDSPVM
jgi:hypothetical protein